MRYLFAVLITVLLGCSSGIEESTSWPDSHMEAAFEQALKDSGIKYRKEGRQFFYQVGDRAAINKVRHNIINEYFPEGAFFFYKEDDWGKAKSRLDAEKIPYRSIVKDDSYGIVWDKSYTSNVHQIIHDITRIPLDLLGHKNEENPCASPIELSEPVCSIITIQEHDVSQAKSDFEKLGIYYDVLKSGSEYIVQWKSEDNGKVLGMLKNADYYYDPKK
jgi:hypothetical protein